MGALALNQFHERIGELVPRLLRHTVPIYRLEVNTGGNDRLLPCKSGVFIHIGNEFFIITASHDLESHLQAGPYLFLGDASADEEPGTVIGTEFHWTEPHSRDIAILRLPTHTVEKLRKKYQYITMEDIAEEHDDKESLYLLAGYPGHWATICAERVAGGGLVYLCKEVQCNADISNDNFEHNTAIHRLVCFDRIAIHKPTNEQAELPKPGGISGCGLWQFATVIDGVVTYLPSPKLIGIQHRYNQRHKLAITTRIIFAMLALADSCESIRPAMRLTYSFV
jgi:hypothetical protein